jgi:hydroxymethylpyrimidine pyrophosphatase-like HAD family hydrolase
MKRLIVFDLDGTLAESKAPPGSCETKRVIEAIIACLADASSNAKQGRQTHE